MISSKALYRFSARMQRALTPGLRYSQSHYEDVLRERVAGATRWLDLGCGHAILPAWRADAEQALVDRCPEVVGLDYDFDALRNSRSLTRLCRGDISTLPFRDESFDLVTANMVVEHLSDPAQQFREVWRVLKPGGFFVFHTPNELGHPVVLSRLLPYGVKRRAAQLLEGRAEEDVYPTYYRANRRTRIAHLSRRAGFDPVEIRLITTSPMFNVVPPLLLVELLWIRLLMTQPFSPLRSNIICVLCKP
jgi:SAM-dependent methyltransferase